MCILVYGIRTSLSKSRADFHHVLNLILQGVSMPIVARC